MGFVDTARARWRLRACEAVGADPQVIGLPTIYANPGRIRIGDRFRFASWPAESHIAMGPEGLLEIGNDVSIACGAAIAAYESVRIGDGTVIGPFSVIMDTNFHGASGGRVLQHDTRPISIGRGCRIGSRVTITRGSTIGDGTEILSGSVVSASIPAGPCAAGGRAVVLGPAGEVARGWNAFIELPELIRQMRGLSAAPDLDAVLGDVATTEDLSRLRTSIEARFNLAIDESVLAPQRRLVAVACDVAKMITTSTIERSRRGPTSSISNSPLR